MKLEIMGCVCPKWTHLPEPIQIEKSKINGLGRKYPIQGEYLEAGLFGSRISYFGRKFRKCDVMVKNSPFPIYGKYYRIGKLRSKKSSLTVKIPKLRCFCRTCHFKAKIIKTKCLGRNSPSRAKLLNLGCKVHKYLSQIVVLRSKSPNFRRNFQHWFVWLENAPILGENRKLEC